MTCPNCGYDTTLCQSTTGGGTDRCRLKAGHTIPHDSGYAEWTDTFADEWDGE